MAENGIEMKGVKRVVMEIGCDSGKSMLDAGVMEIYIPNTCSRGLGSIVEGRGQDGKPKNENDYHQKGMKKDTVSVDLENLPLDVGILVFVVRITKEKTTFDDIAGGYCKLTSFLDSVSLEVCSYDLSNEEFKNEAVMTMCLISRDSLDDWKVIELGRPGIGSKWEPNQVCWGRIREKIITKDIHQGMKNGLMKGFEEIKNRMKELEGEIEEILKDQILIPNAISIKCRAEHVDKCDVFGKSDPYYIVKTEDGKEKFKSEIIMVTLNPEWKVGIVKEVEDLDETFCMDVYDYDKHSSDDFIGTFKFVPSEVIDGKKGYEIINPKKQKKKKYENSGLFVFEDVQTKVYKKKLEYFEKTEELKKEKEQFDIWKDVFTRNDMID